MAFRMPAATGNSKPTSGLQKHNELNDKHSPNSADHINPHKALTVASMRKQFEEKSGADSGVVPVRPSRRHNRHLREKTPVSTSTTKDSDQTNSVASLNKKMLPDLGDKKIDSTIDNTSSKQSINSTSSFFLKRSQEAKEEKAKEIHNKQDGLNQHKALSVAERRKIFQQGVKNTEGATNKKAVTGKPKQPLTKQAHKLAPMRFLNNAERLAHPLGNSGENDSQPYQTPLVKPPVSSSVGNAPVKPPRTFAHNIYVAQKKLMAANKGVNDAQEMHCNKSPQVPKATSDDEVFIEEPKKNYSFKNETKNSASEKQTISGDTSSSSPVAKNSDSNNSRQNCVTSSKPPLSLKPVPPQRPKKLNSDSKISPYSISSVARNQRHVMVENSCYESSIKSKTGCADDLVRTPKSHKPLRRSHSEEHIYTEPYEVLPNSLRAKGKKSNETSPRDHHYMNIPVITQLEASNSQTPCRALTLGMTRNSAKEDENDLSKQRKFLGPTIRDVINQSFSLLRCHLRKRDSVTDDVKPEEKDDSGSEVSVKDVQERIIYVKSVKRQRCNEQNQKNSSIFLFKLLVVADLSKDTSCQSYQMPRTLIRFPQLQPSESDWAMLVHLCFPDLENCVISDPTGREHMLFIFCDEKGEKMFGHCLRYYKSSSERKPFALCLLSCIYAPSFYFQLLNEIANNSDMPEDEWYKVLSDLHRLHPPSPGGSIIIPFQNQKDKTNIKLTRPSDLQLENAPVTQLLQLLDVDLLLKVVASLVLERRVLLLGSSFSILSQCCTAIMFLLYPFTWQHMAIPVLPECLLSETCTASPYLMGVFTSLSEKVCEMVEDQILIVDVDHGRILREVGDENTIFPSKIHHALEIALNLAKNMTDPTGTLRDIMISEAFVRMFVETVGHYGDFIIQHPDKTQSFHKEAFCKFPSSQSIQVFLQWFTETQMFESFISECLHKKQHLLVLEEWKVLPLHSQLETCLFDRRALEYKETMMQGAPCFLKNNLREFGMKVRNLGMKLRKALE